LVLGDPRQIECVDELRVGLPDVDGGDPALRRAAVALKEPVHHPAHLVVERCDLPRRLPRDQTCHLVLLPSRLFACPEYNLSVSLSSRRSSTLSAPCSPSGTTFRRARSRW